MNSIHDLGGMHGMGPVEEEVNEPYFHEEWERLAFGTHLLPQMAGLYSADETRHAMERIPALRWLASPYYEHWLDGTVTMLLETGLVTAEELATGRAQTPLPEWVKQKPAVSRDKVAAKVRSVHAVCGEVEDAPAFAVGDRVRALNIHPRTHTRLPRYIRGHVGTIDRHYAACLYADERALKEYGALSHTYSVRFEAEELWGPDAERRDALYIDLYETYLERA